MSTRTRVEIAGGYAMPSVCCACGGPAGPSALLETAGDPASRRMIAVHFPLCRDCGRVVRITSGWRGEQGARRCPMRLRKRFEQIDAAVRISHYRPIVLSTQPAMTIEFANETFARMFETANRRPVRR